jgi:hypothetical protein
MFDTGKVYACQYFQAKNDPSPVLLVFSTGDYVEGLNVKYLDAFEQQTLARIMMKYSIMFRDVGMTGSLLYGILKRDIRSIVYKSYRKYHFKYIRGYIVSNGFRYSALGYEANAKVRYSGHGFVRYFANLMDAKVLALQKSELETKKTIVDKLARGVKFVKNWWQEKL